MNQPPNPDAVLELVQTRLRVVQGELQRRNKDGGFTLRLPLTAIESVEFRRKWESFTLPFLATGLGLALIAFFVAENNVVNVVLYIIAAGMGFIGLFGLFGREIRIRSHGAVTKIQCLDDADEGDGFVCSLRQLIDRDEIRDPHP